MALALPLLRAAPTAAGMPLPLSACTSSGLADAARERGRAAAPVGGSCERSLDGGGGAGTGAGGVGFPPVPPPAPPVPLSVPVLSSWDPAGLGERGRGRGSWALAIGSGWGDDRSAGAGVGSAGVGPLAGVSARAGRGGLGWGRACIGCDGGRDAAGQPEQRQVRFPAFSGRTGVPINFHLILSLRKLHEARITVSEHPTSEYTECKRQCCMDQGLRHYKYDRYSEFLALHHLIDEPSSP